MTHHTHSPRRNTRLTWALALAALLILVTAGVALAWTNPSNKMSFKLEGCDIASNMYVNGSYNPDAGDLTCNDAAYGTGNMGKGWNELDLVPHRLTMQNADSAPTTYNLWIGGDHFNGGTQFGWDVVTVPVVNTALSSGTCSVIAAPQEIRSFTGGTNDSVVRQLTVTQSAGSTCVIDWVQRLALGASGFSGSSLQSYMAETEDLSIGKKTISIPVREALPQTLSKMPVASQHTDHIWTLAKNATPAALDFGDVCAATTPAELPVSVVVEWVKGPATPSGDITVKVSIHATNPAMRSVTATVNDKLYAGATLLDDHTFAPVVVPANTANFAVVVDYTVLIPSGSTEIHDVATATYVDTITGIAIPQTTTASASVTQIQTGDTLNASAAIADSESISGAGLEFKVTSPTTGYTGSPAYVPPAWTTDPVLWGTNATDSGSVTFSKVVRRAGGQIVEGLLSDTATLNGSNGAVANASASINIVSSARATLTIVKNIPNILQSGETATFAFSVRDANNIEVAAPSITFASGETSKSASVSDLTPGVYTVVETPAAGFSGDGDKTVDLSGAICTGSVTFNNSAVPASAKVSKITSPAGFEAGWTFDLKDGSGNVIGTATTTGAGFVAFSNQLGEGSYSIVETAQPGWVSDGGAGCSFTVDLPADAYREFACTFTNTYRPSVTLDKGGDTLSKIGDGVEYVITLNNTSPAPGPAGAPSLACTISDSTIGFSEDVTLAAGASDVSNVPFTIPAGASDPFPNTANASCTYVGGTTEVASASEGHSINLFQPGLTFSKSADTALSTVGGVINYVLTLNNTSSADSPSLVCTITDAKLGINKQVTLASGVTDVTNAAYTVQADDPDPVINQAAVTCLPADFPNVLAGTAVWSVNLFQPAITVAKNGPAYTKQGDVAAYEVTITNNSSADAPNLVLTKIEDSLVGNLMDLSNTAVTASTCAPAFTLASGASCKVNYNYLVADGSGANLVNTVAVESHPTDFTTAVNGSASHTTILLHPDYNVIKVCKAQPVPQAGPALFTITFQNLGDADLIFTHDEGSPVTIPADGEDVSFDVTVNGPFAGRASVDNTVSGVVTLAAKYGLDNRYSFSASGSCTVAGLAKVVKTVQGAAPSGTDSFTFQLRQGASTIADGTILETQVANAANGGVLNFTTLLVPGQQYQMCEAEMLPGWDTNLGPNPFVPNSVLPGGSLNPNTDNSVLCVNFTAQAGAISGFAVDNTPPPGGMARTIGYWKNHASCKSSNGNQAPVLDQTLALAGSSGIVVSAFNGTPYLVLHGSTTTPDIAPDCADARNLLDKRRIDTGKKMASDPAFNLAAQLVAVQLNLAAGADPNGVTPYVTEAVQLLGKYAFNGKTHTKISNVDAARMNVLARILDNYNNNRPLNATVVYGAEVDEEEAIRVFLPAVAKQ